MRFYHRQAEEAQRRLLTGDLWVAEGDDPNQGIIDGLKEVIELRKRAGDEAARAARYVHPRMGYSDGDDPEDDFVPLAVRLAYYQQRGRSQSR
jgi:hypothetical protein